MVTLDDAVVRYLEIVRTARSAHTARTYANAAKAFRSALLKHGVDPAMSPAANIGEDAITWLIKYLKDLSPATEALYVQAAAGFYQFLAAEKLADVNLPRVALLIRQRARRPGMRLPQFPIDDITKLLKSVEDPFFIQEAEEQERLRALRDRAFLLTLGDTGLRVHEACKLRRGDVDMNEGQALVVGKGDTQAVVRFSTRSLKALRDYLSARAPLDGTSGKPLGALPLFARHDKGAGKKVKRMTTETGRNIVRKRVAQALGESATGRITPHSLRHYFVTTVLRSTGNLKMAQEMARHKSMQVTQRYAHLSNQELDKAYDEIFNKHAGNDRE